MTKSGQPKNQITQKNNSKLTQCTVSSGTTKNWTAQLRRRTNISLSAPQKKGLGAMSKESLREKLQQDVEKYLQKGGTIKQCPRGESERDIFFQDKN